MSKKANLHLFKERITVTDKEKLIEELYQAIDSGTDTLKMLLFGTRNPAKYHGTFHHHHCEGLSYSKDRNFTEKRLCKCMYFFNSTYPKRCDHCASETRYQIIGDYEITDYEVPAFYDGDGIGEIDLIITKDDIHYATEVKPYKGNNETLLRMIAEIMTYTEGYPNGTYKKAIAFFEKNRDDGEKTAQQKEYESAAPALLALLKKADITVFRFEEAGEKAYQICKL